MLKDREDGAGRRTSIRAAGFSSGAIIAVTRPAERVACAVGVDAVAAGMLATFKDGAGFESAGEGGGDGGDEEGGEEG